MILRLRSSRLANGELINSDYINYFFMADISVRIKHIIIEKTDVQESEITDEASFIKDLAMDSLDLVDLLMEMEKEFAIDIPDEEIEKITTVGSLIRYVTFKKR